jgi:hypothetical protein
MVRLTDASLTAFDHSDGWDDAADEISERIIRGSLLKFADWRWTYGQEGTPLKEGTRLVALGTAAAWVRWVDGKPAEYQVRRPGESLPDRGDLGDTDESKWEGGPDCKPRDPWQNSRFVYLVDPATAEAFTFSTSSWGGRGAVIDLGDQIKRMRFARQGALPVVELHAAPMQTKFGKKSKPWFKVVDWVGGADDNERQKQIESPARNGDMNDVIPV